MPTPKRPPMRAAKAKTPRTALEIMDADWGQRPGHRAAVQREREKLALGERIRDAREAQGLTQAQLAQIVGTTQSAIARLEAAEYTNFKLDTLLNITAALKGTFSVCFPVTPARVKVKA